MSDPFFKRISGGRDPHPWQRTLLEAESPRTQVIRVPTGMGKTLGVFGAWAYHRLERGVESWPRRLVWCLPMRVLVEQTEAVVRGALENLDRLWDGERDHTGKVGCHVLMGGAEPGGDWTLYPEEAAVLIGTQDMLLSRALNRGFAAGRARWPLDFGLLSHDTLWVMDEVQLMDVGLATSAQLQAFHEADAANGFRPRLTWWMSATLQPSWLTSIDTADAQPKWVENPVAVQREGLTSGLGLVEKKLEVAHVGQNDAKDFADVIVKAHAKLTDGPFGRITLVVCNTVERAMATFDALTKAFAKAPDQPALELVHSRFRPSERQTFRSRFLNREACVEGVSRIVVATQVVEAGVDVSAGCVVTELAPWSSLVQRFGRAARYGGTARVIVIDRSDEAAERDDKSSLPYDGAELDGALEALRKLTDVGIASLESFEAGLDDEARSRLYPYEPAHLLRREELDELFDTTADLSGGDLDVARFIRSGEERDLSVFWVDARKERRNQRQHVPFKPNRRPRREELCPVPFLRARAWLCGEATKSAPKPRLKAGVRAWLWDYLEGDWVVADRAAMTPGKVLCVAADVGGYHPKRGFDPTSSSAVAPLDTRPLDPKAEALIAADESDEAEDLSASPSSWKTIATHGHEAATEAESIGRSLGLGPRLHDLFVLAALFHDVGKSHPAFQGAIRLSERPLRQDLAKAPKDAWPKPPSTYRTVDDQDKRPGLRHELASALALFAILERHAPDHPALRGGVADVLSLCAPVSPEAGERPRIAAPSAVERRVLACSAEEFDLVAYWVASHHGKVRTALQASPGDQRYRDRDSDGRGLPIRGVREGDVLPPIALGEGVLPALTVTLAPASLGVSIRTGKSWRDRTQALLARFGPGALAYLEALLMAADRRASRLETNDPLLSGGEAS
jgi:CRISPR-associated endonuclease/helicase Cas3